MPRANETGTHFSHFLSAVGRRQTGSGTQPASATQPRTNTRFGMLACPGVVARLPLLFVQILAGDVVFRYFAGADFLLVVSRGVFDARYDPCLERVAFLH
jgi:hypothetical protein